MRQLPAPGGSFARDLTAVSHGLMKPADASALAAFRKAALSQSKRYRARQPSRRAFTTRAPPGAKAFFNRLWKNNPAAVEAIRQRVYATLGSVHAGRCPYCRLITQVKTIDHFLEKHVVPELTLYHHNLLPSCGDCNHGRKRSFHGGAQQVIHFYDDAVDSIPDVLQAKLVETGGMLTAEFSIVTPTPAAADLYARHFIALKLAPAYREVSSAQIREYLGLIGLAKHEPAVWVPTLLERAQSLQEELGNNEPSVALLRAMAADLPMLQKYVTA